MFWSKCFDIIFLDATIYTSNATQIKTFFKQKEALKQIWYENVLFWCLQTNFVIYKVGGYRCRLYKRKNSVPVVSPVNHIGWAGSTGNWYWFVFTNAFLLSIQFKCECMRNKGTCIIQNKADQFNFCFRIDSVVFFLYCTNHVMFPIKCLWPTLLYTRLTNLYREFFWSFTFDHIILNAFHVKLCCLF